MIVSLYVYLTMKMPTYNFIKCPRIRINIKKIINLIMIRFFLFNWYLAMEYPVGFVGLRANLQIRVLFTGKFLTCDLISTFDPLSFSQR